MSKKRLSFVWAAVVVAVAACAPFSVIAPDQPPAGALHGRIELPRAWRVAATTGDLRGGSTISLIDPVSNLTVATAPTTDPGLGGFTLDLSNGGNTNIIPGFTLQPGFYYLEASYLPAGTNKPFLSLRTIVAFTGTGWKSVTSGGEAGPVMLNGLTTAVSTLKAADGTLTFHDTLNSVPGGTAPVTLGSHSAASVTALATVINNAVAADSDPVGSAIVVSGSSPAAKITPGMTTLTLQGWGFDTTAARNRVRFTYKDTANVTRTRLAIAQTAAINSLVVRVPSDMLFNPADTALTVEVASNRAWSNARAMTFGGTTLLNASSSIGGGSIVSVGGQLYALWSGQSTAPQFGVVNPATHGISGIVTPAPAATNPILVADDTGRLHYLYTTGDAVFHQLSTDSGASWSAASSLSVAGLGTASSLHAVPVAGGKVAAVWLQTGTVDPRNVTLVSGEWNGAWTVNQAVDGGAAPLTNFSQATQALSVARSPILASSGGTVDLMWVEGSPSGAYHARWSGTAWSAKTLISPAGKQLGGDVALTYGDTPARLFACWNQDPADYTGALPLTLNMRLANYDGLTWTTEPDVASPSGLPYGQAPQLVVDAAGKRHLFWKEGNLHSLMHYATKTGAGAWSPALRLGSAEPSYLRVVFHTPTSSFFTLWHQEHTNNLFLSEYLP